MMAVVYVEGLAPNIIVKGQEFLIVLKPNTNWNAPRLNQSTNNYSLSLLLFGI